MNNNKCENCIHGDECFSRWAYRESKTEIGNCNHFKDKSLFVELPCKVGDKVYRLNYLCSAVNEATVKAIYYTEDKKYYPKSHIIIQYGLARGRVRVNFNDFGKTVFLTKEEAEAKLKEIGE